VSAALVGTVVGLAVFLSARVALVGGRRNWVSRRIEPHLALRQVEAVHAIDRPGLLARLEGLFGPTERRLRGTRSWDALTRLVERADVPLRPVEAFYAVTGSGLVLGLVLALASGSPAGLLLGLLLVGLCALAVLRLRAARRLRAFDEQLPEFLTEVASALRAGHSFVQALRAVADDARPPIGKEFGRVLAEARLGRPVELALADMTRRMPSPELEFVLTAITIQRQVGGSLAALFETVVETVQRRHQFRRKLRSLTAMGRASAWVVGIMPFAMAAFQTALNRSYMSPLLHTSIGHKLIVLGIVLMAVGALVLKKIVTIKG
jgi:tight adherence protein B